LPPLLLFPLSLFIALKDTNSNDINIGNLAYLLLAVNSITIATMILSSALHCKHTISQNQAYALACPIACFIVSAAFVSSAIRSIKRWKYNTINWKGREYATFKK